MTNSYVEVVLIFYLVFCLLLSGAHSILQLIILGELLWLLFFLQLHFLLNSFLLIDLIFFFIIVLSLTTIDLGAVLALLILEGSLNGFSGNDGVSKASTSHHLFNSVAEGSFLSVSFSGS